MEVNLVDLAGQLASARHDLAQQLVWEIKQETMDLIWKSSKPGSRENSVEGNERVEVNNQPHEDFKPLVKWPTGGELSRLMLAIKSAFSRKEGKTSIVFDEVDTGVSGRVAQAIAQKILRLVSVVRFGYFPFATSDCDCRLSILY